jgi:hypothetical protein
MADQPSSLPSSIPQGTPSAPAQTPPSFGAQLLGNKEFSVELNDAVMETQAWRNSRYNGQQLEAVEINQFTGGDKTYGKTPVIEKYSRNIYVGNRVIGYDEEPTRDDPNPGFLKKSYINIEGYYTINSDDTVSKVGVNFRDVNSRKGFERSFREDFSIGSQASIVVLDKGVEHNLKNSYTVDFNEGLLSRTLEYSSSLEALENVIFFRGTTSKQEQSTPPRINHTITTGFLPNSLTGSAEITIYNNNQSKYFTDISGSGTFTQTLSDTLDFPSPITVFESFINASIDNANEDLASNKVFIEFKTYETENRTPYSYNIESFGLNSVNVFEIDINNTAITNFGDTNNSYGFRLKRKNRFSNPLITEGTPDELLESTTTHFRLDGSNDINKPANNIVFYKLNPIPSILINLIKEEDLPNGIGEEGFIVIPENFDPRLRPQINKILKDKLGFNIESGFNRSDDTNPFGNRFFGFRGS